MVLRRLPLGRCVPAIALAAFLAACSQPPRIQTVRVAIAGPLVTLNPVLAFSYDANYVAEAIFDGLVKIDARGRVVPDLALEVPSLQNGGISPDGRTIVYHLRRGVLWQDGHPFTSADVAFTYALLRNPKVNGVNRVAYRLVAALTTPDAYTVRVRLRRPSAVAVGELFCNGENGAIVPRHLLARSRDVNHDPFGVHPVGTGPYIFDSWERGGRLVLRANSRYFGGAPKIPRLEIVEVPKDDSLLALVASHGVDVARLPTRSAPGLRDVAHVRTEGVATNSEMFLTFNLKRAPFHDPRVRRALALALDRPRLARLLYGPRTPPAQTLIPPSSWAYARDSGAPRYDPRAAAKLLDRAGWKLGADGIRRNHGRPLAFQLLTTPGSVFEEGVVEIQAQWRLLGIDATVRVQPASLLYGQAGALRIGRFDTALQGQGFDPDPDRSELVDSAFIPPRGRNFARYRDADVDRWSALALATYDRAARASLYARMQRRLNRDLPYVPIAWVRTLYAVDDRLRGFEPEAVNSDLWNVSRWYFAR